MLQARTATGRGLRRRRGLAAALLAGVSTLWAASPAAAQAARSSISPDGHSLILAPGELVYVSMTAGRLIMLSSVPSPPGAALPPKPGKGDLDPGRLGAIGFLLGVAADGKSTLKIDSGLSQALDYSATLRRDAASADEPARACTLLPLLASWEQWPYAVSRLTLTGFAVKSTNEVTCSGPADSKEMIP
jgi:hypothetical protein